MQNLATQEGEAWRSLGRVEGAKILCEALLKKVREDEAKPDEPETEG